MEKKNNIIKIFWLIIFSALVLAAMVLLQTKDILRSDKYIYLSLLVAAFLGWGYVGLRVVIFRRKLAYFIQRILENQYQTGIKINPIFNDEITWLEKNINKLVDQLRKYDELQIDRISALVRTIDNILPNVKEGIILYNLNDKVFQINPVVQAFFQVELGNFSYDSLAKQETNNDFILLLKESIEQGKTVRNVKVTLELPIRLSRKDVVLTIIPIKDKNECVELVIMFLSLAN